MSAFILAIVALVTAATFLFGWLRHRRPRPGRVVPLSVNFHFTRKCNYECGFCFHTAKTSYLTPLDKAKEGLTLVAAAGMVKINFSGGEPFLYGEYLGELVKYCKTELGLQSVSIVSNGSKIREKWFESYAKYLDILAVSVDSFDEETNVLIGRGRGKHIEQLERVARWCRDHQVKFKLNSVICRHNWSEDMVESIAVLDPFRWKAFQCLLVDTENTGAESGALRNARDLLISDEQFEDFCSRHEHLPCFVPEPNVLMASSYIILDEYMRFLNKGAVYRESESILDVGVERALADVDFQQDAFDQRGGVYDWTRTDHLTSSPSGGGCGGGLDKNLEF